MIDIDHSQRLKHANRIPFAASCLLRQCGIRLAKHDRPNVTINNVYRVEGHDEDLIGVEALRGWLWDHGVKATPATISKVAKEGQSIGPYKLSLVGTVKRNKAAKLMRTEEIPA